MPDVALNLFDLTVAEHFRAFAKDKIDLSFVREVRLPAKAGLQRDHIQDCDVMVALPENHPEANAPPVKLSELRSLPSAVLAKELYRGAGDWLRRVCQNAGFAPKIAPLVALAPTMLSSVAVELGVALLPEACRTLPHKDVTFHPLGPRARA